VTSGHGGHGGHYYITQRAHRSCLFATSDPARFWCVASRASESPSPPIRPSSSQTFMRRPTWTTARPDGIHKRGWAVLILIGVRLGLDGVNPIYYDTIKVSRPYCCALVPPSLTPIPRHFTPSHNRWASPADDLRLHTALSAFNISGPTIISISTPPPHPGRRPSPSTPAAGRDGGAR
jgi:hypothetical protein